MKDHVKILLVGDSQVGKSSLLSSFVSRHFPQEVPPVLADAVIPPETTANNVCVTIMDSSAKQSDRETLRQKISIADSIIALYDVTRTETLDNLSKVWLPMIRDSANGGEVKPVVIVGTKMDLLVEEEDIEKLHYILTNFPFALICWHCSAAKLQDVDQVFYYGEIIVTCPLSPMYDIIATEFTPACRKAFLRIFRIFDRDNDNLLSDQEVCQCQYSCFEVPINNEELMAIKKQISKKIPGGIMHNCVTFEGWLGIIKMNIDKHNFTFPWTILRRFDYEDDLRILVPPAVAVPPSLAASQVTELSTEATAFLIGLARNAYHDCAKPIGPESSDSSNEDGDILTWEAVRNILSVLPSDTVHPWSEPSTFKSYWSTPSRKVLEQSIILAGLAHAGANMSLDSWLTQWNIIALNDPALAQVLLFKLGYVERDDLGVKIAEGNVLNIASCYIYDSLWTSVASSLNFVPKADVIEPRATVKVCVLGDNRVGKSSFVWRLSGLKVPGSDEVEKGVENVKKADSVVIGGFCKKRSNRTAAFATASSAVAEKGSDVLHAAPTTVKHLKGKYYLSISSVPLEVSQTWIARNIVSCDLVVLMFECGHVESLETVLELEKLLPPNIPRIFLASKSDLLPVSRSVASAVGNAEDDITRRHEIVLQKITLHLQEEGLLPVQMLSSTTGDGICSTVASIASIMEDPETAIPVKHRRQQTTSSWLSTKSVAVVAAAVGIMAMTLIIRYNKDLKAWIKDLMHSNKGRKIVSPMNFNVSNYFLSEFQSHKRIETI